MAIRLIHEDETYSCTIEGAEFDYRRLPDDQEDRIRQANTVRGKLDNTAYMLAILAYCVRGWRGVLDAKGEPVEYAPDKFRAFPKTALQTLVRTILFSVEGELVLHDPF